MADVPHSTITRHAKQADCWRAYCTRRAELKRRLGDVERAWQQAYVEVVVPAMRQEAGEDGAAMLDSLSNWLVPAAMFADKPDVSSIEEVEWVKNHIAIADVRAEDAPSSGAWAMLYYVRTNHEGAKQFWTSINTKLFPSRSQLEKAAAFKDDGQDIDELLLKELRRAAAEAASAV